MKSKSREEVAHKNELNPYNKYEIKQLIGQGQTGKVYKAILHNCPQQVFAIKIIPFLKLKNNPKLKQLLKNQIQILCTIKHPNIIQFQELFCWQHKIYMVYEYCEGGSLQQLLPFLSERQATQIFRQIVSACQFAQKSFIMHRDLKPANILFKKGIVKVADWGFCKFLQGELTTKSYVGSPAYMAPQVLKGEKYTNKADVWSFGVLAFECLFGKLPWKAHTTKQLKQLIKKKIALPKSVNTLHQQILQACLEYDENKRASFEKIAKVLSKPNFQSKNFVHANNIQMNPEQSVQGLCEKEVKMCTYFLQFTKQSQNFENQSIRRYCLDYLFTKLIKLKNKKRRQLKNNFSELKIVKTQKKFRCNKIEINSPKSQNKPSETYSLLEKEITLIEKIRQKFESSLQACTSARKLKHIIISLIQKHLNLGTKKRIIIEYNLVLNILLFGKQYSEFINQNLIQDMWQMQKASKSKVLELLNTKIQCLQQKTDIFT